MPVRCAIRRAGMFHAHQCREARRAGRALAVLRLARRGDSRRAHQHRTSTFQAAAVHIEGMTQPSVPFPDQLAQRGAALYTPRNLAFYDVVVHGVSNAVAWRCPTRALQDLYDQHARPVHLDVGVGSGLLLERCRFSRPPAITLLDMSSSALAFAGRRLQGYRPTCVRANVLEPVTLSGRYESIGMTYLLHCLPGDMASKAVVFQHLGRYLTSDGQLFGATVLGRGVQPNAAARCLLALYNARGIFSNRHDDRDGLERALAQSFSQYELWSHGCVALFRARGYRPLSKPDARVC